MQLLEGTAQSMAQEIARHPPQPPQWNSSLTRSSNIPARLCLMNEKPFVVKDLEGDIVCTGHVVERPDMHNRKYRCKITKTGKEGEMNRKSLCAELEVPESFSLSAYMLLNFDEVQFSIRQLSALVGVIMNNPDRSSESE